MLEPTIFKIFYDDTVCLLYVPIMSSVLVSVRIYLRSNRNLIYSGGLFLGDGSNYGDTVYAMLLCNSSLHANNFQF